GYCFLFQAEDGIRDATVTGVQTCALPILTGTRRRATGSSATSSAWSARWRLGAEKRSPPRASGCRSPVPPRGFELEQRRKAPRTPSELTGRPFFHDLTAIEHDDSVRFDGA